MPSSKNRISAKNNIETCRNYTNWCLFCTMRPPLRSTLIGSHTTALLSVCECPTVVSLSSPVLTNTPSGGRNVSVRFETFDTSKWGYCVPVCCSLTVSVKGTSFYFSASSRVSFKPKGSSTWIKLYKDVSLRDVRTFLVLLLSFWMVYDLILDPLLLIELQILILYHVFRRLFLKLKLFE